MSASVQTVSKSSLVRSLHLMVTSQYLFMLLWVMLTSGLLCLGDLQSSQAMAYGWVQGTSSVSDMPDRSHTERIYLRMTVNAAWCHEVGGVQQSVQEHCQSCNDNAAHAGTGGYRHSRDKVTSLLSMGQQWSFGFTCSRRADHSQHQAGSCIQRAWSQQNLWGSQRSPGGRGSSACDSVACCARAPTASPPRATSRHASGGRDGPLPSPAHHTNTERKGRALREEGPCGVQFPPLRH